MDIPQNLPDQNSNWMPRLPHVLGGPICSMNAQDGDQGINTSCYNLSGSLHKLDPEEMWPDPPWPHYSPTVPKAEDRNGVLVSASVICGHSNVASLTSLNCRFSLH